MSPRLGLWLTLFSLFAAVFAAAPARASGALVGDPVKVCVARAQPGMTANAVLTHPRGFDCHSAQTAFGPGDYWVVSNGLPAGLADKAPLRIRTANQWQRAITIHVLYPDGKIVTRRMDDVGASRGIQLGAILQQRLPYVSGAPLRIAWHVEGAANLRGILVAPRIASPAEIARANTTMAALYAAFAGLTLALLIHNLAMWRVIRQRFQLWYVAMLACILAYAFSASGALAWVWPDVPNTMRLRISYVALTLIVVAASRFMRSFFEARVFSRWLSRLFDAAALALLAATALFVVAAPWRMPLLDSFYNAAFLLVLSAVVLMLWCAWREKSDYFWVFVATWAVPLSLGILRIGHNYGLIPWNFWIDNSTLLSLGAEALGASLAIAYRLRLIARERDTARAQELAARLLADTDPLTGLLNRRAFLTQAVGRTGDQALMILDLDRFKSVNDTIGHDGGDEVLRRIARALRNLCPSDGLVARLGGEEFALLTNVDSKLGVEALLDRVRETRMPYDLTVTASIGACAGPLRSEKDWKALYRGADQALFAAKKAGRNRGRTAEAILAA